MNAPLSTYFFQSHPVRVLGTHENPLFVAADVCRILCIENSRDATASLDADERITVSNPDGNPRAGIPHQITCVTESGLYALIFKSRKPEAKAFRKWVTAEVLPAIRKTGSYRPPGMSALDQLELMLKAAREQERRIAEVEQLAIQSNSYSNTGFLTVRAFANARGIRLPLSKAREVGQRAGEVKSYPVEVLDEICPNQPATGAAR